MTKDLKSAQLMLIGAVLVIAALACGPLSQVSDAVQEAEQAAEDAGELIEQAEQAAEDAGDLVEEMEDVEESVEEAAEVVGVQLNSCSLLTDDEVAGFIGSPITSRDDAGPAVCIWEGESGRRASVSAQTFPSVDLAITTFDTRVSINDDEGSELIDGVGDQAFWAATTSGQLYVRQSLYQLTINCGDWSTYPDARECVEPMAILALSRIPTE